MKRLLVVLVLLAGLTAVAFASFNNSNKKTGTGNKVEKRACKHTCTFS